MKSDWQQLGKRHKPNVTTCSGSGPRRFQLNFQHIKFCGDAHSGKFTLFVFRSHHIFLSIAWRTKTFHPQSTWLWLWYLLPYIATTNNKKYENPFTWVEVGTHVSFFLFEKFLHFKLIEWIDSPVVLLYLGILKTNKKMPSNQFEFYNIASRIFFLFDYEHDRWLLHMNRNAGS